MTQFDIASVEFTVEEGIAVLQPLFILIVGIFLYSWFIFKFYRFLAQKNIFKLNLGKYHEAGPGFFSTLFGAIFYIVEYILVFPLFVFFWFIIISIFIGLISSRPFPHVLLASMGLVAAIRVSAYYNEDLSKDLAKMIPFALLGIFIIDVRLITFPDILALFWQILSVWKNIIYYLGLTIALEIILRLSSAFFGLFKKSD